MEPNLDQILEDIYKHLEPFSNKYRVDFRRYLYTVRLARTLVDLPNKKVLDVGCGIGISLSALRKLGAETVGLDKYIFSDEESPLFKIENMDKLKDKWQSSGVTILEKDIFDFATPSDNKPDLIIAEAIIEHQLDPKKFLEKIYFNLKPNGLAIISTPNLSSLLKRARFLLGRSPDWDLRQFFDLGERFTGHWREYTTHELRLMCEWAGFQVVKNINVNLLSQFKGFKKFRWIYLYIFKLVSDLIPGTRDMNYIVIKKP